MDLFVADVGTGVFAGRPAAIQNHTPVYVSSYAALGEMIRTVPGAVVLSDVKNNLAAIRRCQADESRLIVFAASWNTGSVLHGLHQQASGFLKSNDEKALCLALEPILAGQTVMCRDAARAVKYLVSASI